MKRTLFCCAMAICAMTIQAQGEITVVPQMKKGDVRTYITEASTNGKVDISQNSTTRFKVVNASKKGYVIEQNTFFPEDGSGLTINGMSSANSMLGSVAAFIGNTPVLINLDKNTTPVGIKNFKYIKEETRKNITESFNKEATKSGISSNEALMVMQGLTNLIMDYITEASVLDGYKFNESVLTLNGKTIKDGDTEIISNFKGFKMHKTYAVEGNKVIVDAKLNLTKEETKQLLTEMFSKIKPMMSEMAPILDMVIESGQAKIEVVSKNVYEIGEDGWVEKLTTDATGSFIGEQTSMKTITKLSVEK